MSVIAVCFAHGSKVTCYLACDQAPPFDLRIVPVSCALERGRGLTRFEASLLLRSGHILRMRR